jgi:predicted transcriptional regulator
MNVHLEKLGLIEWLAQLQDTSVLEKVKAIRTEHSSISDWWDEVPQDHKDAISRGLKDVEEGNVHSHEEAKKLYAKYL